MQQSRVSRSCLVKRVFVVGVVLLPVLTVPKLLLADSGPGGQSKVAWRVWSDDIFQRAKSEQKLVVLNLEAVWCHWCHVMEAQTYSRTDVAELLNQRFIPVKVDQDSRPDLSTRYQDYGWPATIFFNSSGKELAKRSGFIEPEAMVRLLQRLVENPEVAEEDNSGDSVLPDLAQAAAAVGLAEELKQKLLDKHLSAMDLKIGGLNISHRYLDGDMAEFALSSARNGSEVDSRWVKLTLENNLNLLDPVWGGVYQYSTYRSWDHPHFEKIVRTQAKNLRIYSLAYAKFEDDRFLKAGEAIFRYLREFLLSPEGGFYTSQDADLVKGQHSADYFKLDDKQRRLAGIPAVDKHMYARENGQLISALAHYYGYTGDVSALAVARRAADWAVENRSLGGGGFSHDKQDVGGPYLGDSLAMGAALLDLYTVTGERKWIERSAKTLEFIGSQFVERDGSGAVIPGFVAAKIPKGLPLSPVREQDENIALARFANLLSHYLGRPDYKDLAVAAMRYLGTSKVSLQYIANSGILLADEELRTDPLHITVVGRRDDPASSALLLKAVAFPVNYKRVELWDKREGPLPHPDVTYPELAKPAAFICTNKRCSLPIFNPDEISKTVVRFSKR